MVQNVSDIRNQINLLRIDSLPVREVSVVVDADTVLQLGGAQLEAPENSTLRISGMSIEGRRLGSNDLTRVVIDGQGKSRLFLVKGTLILERVILTGGRDQYGGAFYVSPQGKVELTDSIITNCAADWSDSKTCAY